VCYDEEYQYQHITRKETLYADHPLYFLGHKGEGSEAMAVAEALKYKALRTIGENWWRHSVSARNASLHVSTEYLTLQR